MSFVTHTPACNITHCVTLHAVYYYTPGFLQRRPSAGGTPDRLARGGGGARSMIDDLAPMPYFFALAFGALVETCGTPADDHEIAISTPACLPAERKIAEVLALSFL